MLKTLTGERTVSSSIYSVGKIEFSLAEVGNKTSVFTPLKTNLKWIQALNTKSKTMKISEENTKKHSKILIGKGNFFFGNSPNTQNMEGKADKRDYIKPWTFSTAKETISVRTQPIKWDKVSANCACDKALISITYEGIMRFNNNTKDPVKWLNDLKRYFLDEEMQMGNKRMGKCLGSPALRECKWKPQWGILSLQKKWLLPKGHEITNAAEHVGKSES